jgi:hypothetical protein
LAGNVHGGGIYSEGGSLHVVDSTVDNNESRWGGGLFVSVDDNSDVVEISGSAIYQNTALINGNTGLGGGLFVRTWASGANLSMVNTTVSGNTAAHSAGIRVDDGSHLVIVNSTITDNHAIPGLDGSQGGGISVLSWANLEIYNSILADNTATNGFADIVRWSQITATGTNNLIGNVGNSGLSTSTNIVGVSPDLAPLGYYGGETRTHALLPTSAAIDAGSDASASAYGLTTDQRGHNRRLYRGTGVPADVVDIGAYEVGLTVSTLIDESDGNYSDGDLSLREALAIAAANPGADMIEFSSSALAIGPATMTLVYDGADAGTVPDELSINSDVTIVGPGSDLLTIDGGGQNRVFNIASGTTVTLQDLTITGGNNVNQGGGIYSYYANLTLDSVRITGNQTYLSGSVNGGGIYSYGGSLHMIDSTVDNKKAGGAAAST